MSDSEDDPDTIAQRDRIRAAMGSTIMAVAALQQDASDEMSQRAPASLMIDDEWLIENDIPLLYRTEAEARMTDVRAAFIALIDHLGWAQRILIPYARYDDERVEGIEEHLPMLTPEAVSAVQYHIAIEQRLRGDVQAYLDVMQTAERTAETAIMVAQQHRAELTEQLNALHSLSAMDESPSEL